MTKSLGISLLFVYACGLYFLRSNNLIDNKGSVLLTIIVVLVILFFRQRNTQKDILTKEK